MKRLVLESRTLNFREWDYMLCLGTLLILQLSIKAGVIIKLEVSRLWLRVRNDSDGWLDTFCTFPPHSVLTHMPMTRNLRIERHSEIEQEVLCRYSALMFVIRLHN